MFARLLEKKKEPKKYVKPRLEILEDRLVPAAPPTYCWAPPNPAVDSNFSTPGNWKDLGTNAAATTPPGPGTCVVFSSSSPTTCIVTLSQACETINTDAAWNGTIDVVGSLNVWGVNDTTGINSRISGGQLIASGGTGVNIVPGIVTENGGYFYYDASKINSTGKATLTFYIWGGGEFDVNKTCQQLNANFEVGYTIAGTNSPGKLVFNTTNTTTVTTMVGTSSITVASLGNVTFSDGAYLGNVGISVSGTLGLGSNAKLVYTNSLAPLDTVYVNNGGVLAVGPTGSAEINGSVTVLSGGTIDLKSDGKGNYAYLTVDKSLDFKDGSALKIRVDLDSNNSNVLIAQNILIEHNTSGVDLDIYPEGTAQTAGYLYEYTPLITTMSLSGIFSFIDQVGGPDIMWSPYYDVFDLFLYGTQMGSMLAPPLPPPPP